MPNAIDPGRLLIIALLDRLGLWHVICSHANTKTRLNCKGDTDEVYGAVSLNPHGIFS
jgi:hypothetical protein